MVNAVMTNESRMKAVTDVGDLMELTSTMEQKMNKRHFMQPGLMVIRIGMQNRRD
jgi:hypothetical protein